ncbi:MAG: serine/threonine protein kinase [Kiritimatiellaeota bacterium]|nr:serine/threonine protein kinase [Kiritimatiellota bacterium]
MSSPVTILVLDSQPLSQIKKALDSSDRLVVFVADPELARHALATMSIGVWICDINTPEADIKSLIAIAENISPCIRILLIGTKSSSLKAKELMKNGRITTFMPRPFAILALVKTVAALLNEYRAEVRKGAQNTPNIVRNPATGGIKITPKTADEKSGGAGFDTSKYDPLRLLGIGGTGSVFLARDKFLDIDVAIKVISPELLSDPETLAAFKDEARIAMQLSHRSIRRIYNFNSHNTNHYLVMEFLRGGTLRDAIIERGALSVATACRVVLLCADALEYAHSNNVIHNDLKPENIFITDSGEVKIIDFGTATLRDAAREINQVVGTPEYISPERLRLAISGPPADIYALGIIAYLMLMGGFPFSAETTANDLLAGTRPDFSSLPGTLAAVLEKATAFNPADRYQDVAIFAADFLAVCNCSQLTAERYAPLEIEAAE